MLYRSLKNFLKDLGAMCLNCLVSTVYPSAEVQKCSRLTSTLGVNLELVLNQAREDGTPIIQASNDARKGEGKKLDGLGTVDNRPSTNKLHRVVFFFFKVKSDM